MEELSLASAFYVQDIAHFSSPWIRIGYCGGGTVHGQQYSAIECIQKAVELDKQCPHTWGYWV